jgi:hypothetical protein
VFADHTKGPDRRIRPTGWATGSGTSFATPHVSGVVALMLEANPDIKPSADSQPIRKILHKTAEARGDPYNKNLSEKYNEFYGYGIVDAYEAVKEAESYVEINHPPEIKQFYADPPTIAMDTSTMVYALASDIDEEILTYKLTASAGTIEGGFPPWKWTAPSTPGTYQLVLTVTDPSGASDEGRTSVVVTEGPPNNPPVITSFTSTHSTLPPGGSGTLQVTASDPDGDTLFYHYEASIGTVEGTTSTATYTAPEEEGTAQITVTVSDGTDGNVKAKLDILIKKLGAGLPPEITSIDISPMTIVEGDENAVVVLTAAVERMDAEIDLVYADISFLGGLKFAYLNDVGAPPDNTPDDGIYSLELSDLGNLGEGKYDIRVTASDIEGRTSSVKSVQLEVIESSAGEAVKSDSDEDDIIFELGSYSISRNTFFIFLIVTIILIIIIFAIARPDRIAARRSNQ